ncbi:Fur-regulated basic protein FbpA [Niallia nealsonii]|uniref:Fur-regulated basic protein FbpA n=1 Tax=Niallia nealsonii TaxID=115979 RepID=A0A2N0YZT3_9BACI|nr:Fur-regulated basic protein FbpA [Niallia nealsonii]PKG22772.1 Fur-regulated basic protein FbpA [Niallia nealsonii]
MDEKVRKEKEKRKECLINKLLALKVYKKDDKHLYDLSLQELEQEFNKRVDKAHPHSDMGSLHWINKKGS